MPDRRVSPAELGSLFKPFECRRVAEIPPFELWETGWGEPFTLQAEEGSYDGWQVDRALKFVIRKTMPPGWPRKP